MMTASEIRRFRLSRVGFRIALVGGLLFAASFVLPYWDASGAHTSPLVQVFQAMTTTYPQSATCVDSCGRPPLLSQITCFWGIPALLLPLLPATQAFRRTPYPAAVAVAMLELLPTAAALVVGAVNTLQAGTSLSDLASYGSVGGEILAGCILMVLGNLLALVTPQTPDHSLLRDPFAPTGHPLENTFLRVPTPPPPPLP